MTSAEQKARILWGSDRHQRGRQRLRQDCLYQLEWFRDPKHMATMVSAIGQDEVDSIIRANEEMLKSLR